MGSGIGGTPVFFGKDGLEGLFEVQVGLAEVERGGGVAGGYVELFGDLRGQLWPRAGEGERSGSLQSLCKGRWWLAISPQAISQKYLTEDPTAI